jgi:hypothetical protein
VEFNAKCFVNFILGVTGTQYSNCTPSGYWASSYISGDGPC